MLNNFPTNMMVQFNCFLNKIQTSETHETKNPSIILETHLNILAFSFHSAHHVVGSSLVLY